MSDKKLNALLSKALSIVAVAFEGKFDRGGVPYFMHCYQVMMNLKTDDIELKIIAVLHDLIEDTDWTMEMLRSEGFSERILAGLSLMTRDHHDKSDEAYDVYIHAIATSYDATRVKLADLEHNMDPSRVKGKEEKHKKLLTKYERSHKYLSIKRTEYEAKI